MKQPTTVLDPRVGDRMTCPGCDQLVEMTPQDGWYGNGYTCTRFTTHSDWILTVFSNPLQHNPLPRD